MEYKTQMTTRALFVTDDSAYLLECPWCNGMVQVPVDQMNCRIFRHATNSKTGEPINPHLSKSECDALVAAKAVHGCAKPFRVFKDNTVEKCDYI